MRPVPAKRTMIPTAQSRACRSTPKRKLYNPSRPEAQRKEIAEMKALIEDLEHKR